MASFFVLMTRLRVRSWRYVPFFFVQAFRSARQAKSAEGVLSVTVLREARNAFWTRTVWINEQAIGASRESDEAFDGMVRRGRCRAFDPRLAGTSFLGGSTPAASGVRTAIQGESSFGKSTQQSNSRSAHPIDERTAIQMTMW
jgi:hypothetical protein